LAGVGMALFRANFLIPAVANGAQPRIEELGG